MYFSVSMYLCVHLCVCGCFVSVHIDIVRRPENPTEYVLIGRKRIVWTWSAHLCTLAIKVSHSFVMVVVPFVVCA